MLGKIADSNNALIGKKTKKRILLPVFEGVFDVFYAAFIIVLVMVLPGLFQFFSNYYHYTPDLQAFEQSGVLILTLLCVGCLFLAAEILYIDAFAAYDL